MKWITRFLASKVSGVIAVIAMLVIAGGGTFIAKQVYDYKELQRKAAYCEGRLSMMDFTRSLSDRAIDQVREGTEDIIRDIEGERDSAEETIPRTEDGQIIPPQGCAANRAPESILRYHGWLRD